MNKQTFIAALLAAALALTACSTQKEEALQPLNDGKKNGAIVMLNNHDTDTLSVTVNVNGNGFSDWSGETLFNLLNPKQVATVSSDGRATLSAPNRGYSIWILKSES